LRTIFGNGVSVRNSTAPSGLANPDENVAALLEPFARQLLDR